MSNVLKSDLIKFLDTLEGPTIDTSQIQKKFFAYTRSNHVARSIQTCLDMHPSLSSDYSKNLTYEGYIQEVVPKISYGRRFGHSYGIAKYLLENKGKKKVLVYTYQRGVLDYRDIFNNLIQSVGEPITNYAKFMPYTHGHQFVTFSNYDAVIFEEPGLCHPKVLEDLIQQARQANTQVIFVGTLP